MFVMLSVRTTSVCERHNKVTTPTTTTANTTTSKATNAQQITTQTTTTTTIATTQIQDHSASIASSLTTTFDNLLINKNSIEKIFTKSVSFDKNINQSNLSLAQPNNLKEPPAQQVTAFASFYAFATLFHLLFTYTDFRFGYSAGWIEQYAFASVSPIEIHSISDSLCSPQYTADSGKWIRTYNQTQSIR